MIRGFRTALAFLTRLSLPGGDKGPLQAEDLARSFAFFPAVGLVVGCLQAAAAAAMLRFLPAPLTAVWALALGTWLTRGLHLDGLADVADGVGGGFDPQKRLAIMKDSRVGAFGVMAVGLALLLKAAALAHLLEAGALASLVIVPAVSRCAMVWCSFAMPYARSEGGLGKPFVDHVGRKEVGWSTAATLLPGVGLLGLRFVPVLLTTILAILGLRILSRRWLGGITGDVLGAANEAVEIVGYTVAAALVLH
ncbi:cobalamin-5'-phosphate synthase [Desulfacinum infernum DSM 9756]|uniref:Adenosylcobinamide-GDP ribazoletransferase n=1 Tax=Desulfacinum infernum DSM 9756 TaxID=1121391 RepID=A0A1M4XLI1_9BACT|nr:adenosylcobinamide-GDP ribazoletransferase [Desulfacinum infernum]SHE94457.1 cobalamin-5'-phosphate synthase [Desulfacinum infernum DSM 9756]